jgi:hypothetical protein
MSETVLFFLETKLIDGVLMRDLKPEEQLEGDAPNPQVPSNVTRPSLSQVDLLALSFHRKQLPLILMVLNHGFRPIYPHLIWCSAIEIFHGQTFSNYRYLRGPRNQESKPRKILA